MIEVPPAQSSPSQQIQPIPSYRSPPCKLRSPPTRAHTYRARASSGRRPLTSRAFALGAPSCNPHRPPCRFLRNFLVRVTFIQPLSTPCAARPPPVPLPPSPTLPHLTPPRSTTSCFCLSCVRTQNIAVVQQCGNYSTLLQPGANFILCPLQEVAGTMSLRIQQMDVVCETKTRDNVFVQCAVAVQYRVLAERIYDAFYKLTDPTDQVRSEARAASREAGAKPSKPSTT